MAELISIRNSQNIREVDIGKTSPMAEVAVANPGYANDTEEIALNDLSGNKTAGDVANVKLSRTRNFSVTQRQPRSHEGTKISYHNVSYTVDTKVKGKKTKLDIVKGVSGVFSPGMNAILGPTGCGKTTTLDILADRKDKTRVSGEIMVNGAKKPSNFRRKTGYVVQHDVVMGLLTVRENIYFSAALRLPASVSSKEKQEKVDKLIDELGLTKVANSKVGTELVRGISGGEKRRTGIGMELVISPEVLFLDEPTTGLDASTAGSVMQLLHDLSRKGNTIIFSIHQPRYSIFKLFDTICLLDDGHTVYHGDADQALAYFEEIGYVCEPHNNPPDFFLDVINSTKCENGEEEENDVEEGQSSCLELAKKFQDSACGQLLNEQVQESLKKMKENSHDKKSKDYMSSGYSTGFFKQLAIVGQRSVRSLIRNPQTTVVQLFVNVFLGLIVGALYFQLDEDELGIQNRVGAFFFIIMNMVFANLDSVQLLLSERALFIHEAASGYYRISVYFLAKIFGELLPYRAFATIVFATISYWMVGFQTDAGKFFIFVLTTVQLSFVACSISFLCSATFGVFAIANLMAAVVYIIMMVFGGLLLNQDSFGDWIGWFRYLSIFKYSLECLNINELDGMTFGNANGTAAQCAQLAGISGSAYLDQQGIDVDMLWWNQLIMFAMITAYCFLTYVQLRRINKDK